MFVRFLSLVDFQRTISFLLPEKIKPRQAQWVIKFQFHDSPQACAALEKYLLSENIDMEAIPIPDRPGYFLLTSKVSFNDLVFLLKRKIAECDAFDKAVLDKIKDFRQKKLTQGLSVSEIVAAFKDVLPVDFSYADEVEISDDNDTHIEEEEDDDDDDDGVFFEDLSAKTDFLDLLLDKIEKIAHTFLINHRFKKKIKFYEAELSHFEKALLLKPGASDKLDFLEPVNLKTQIKFYRNPENLFLALPSKENWTILSAYLYSLIEKKGPKFFEEFGKVLKNYFFSSLNEFSVSMTAGEEVNVCNLALSIKGSPIWNTKIDFSRSDTPSCQSFFDRLCFLFYLASPISNHHIGILLFEKINALLIKHKPEINPEEAIATVTTMGALLKGSSQKLISLAPSKTDLLWKNQPVSVLITGQKEPLSLAVLTKPPHLDYQEYVAFCIFKVLAAILHFPKQHFEKFLPVSMKSSPIKASLSPGEDAKQKMFSASIKIANAPGRTGFNICPLPPQAKGSAPPSSNPLAMSNG